MNIKLNKLTIENFKGIKSFEVELDGENAVIKAENGIGKTTVYDAFLWLLFGKNSEGKKDFQVRPLDGSNQPIKGLVLAVEAEIDCDGTVHTFRKEHHEKINKKQGTVRYETLCTIDEVVKLVNHYKDYITELIPEDTFKLLTDLDHFNGKLHWQDRRKVLLDIAGEIGTPEGFDELLAALNDRKIKEYETVLRGQKKRHEKERDEINPRIDEIQKGFEEYVGEKDIEVLPARRVRIQAEIADLDKQREKLFATEKQRQEKIKLVNELTKKKAEREVQLETDMTGIKGLLDEKVKIEKDVAAQQQIVLQAKADWTTNKTLISTIKDKFGLFTRGLDSIRDEYNKVDEAKTDDTCYACGQGLPKDKLAEIEEKRKSQLAKITREGNELKVKVDACKKEIVELEAGGKILQHSLDKANAELEAAEHTRDKRFAEIDEKIAANQTIPPESDQAWKIFDDQIKKVQAEIGEPVAKQLQQIDNERAEKVEQVAQLDKALAQADRMKQDKARIRELETREKELAQLIADVEEQLATIDKYKVAESQMIEESVNGKFKYTTFAMFNRFLNGEVDDQRCEATLDGVPYPDMSFGQQIFVGLDIVNVLSDHYGMSVPLFIDHSESLTLPIEAKSQTIKLFAEKETKELVVEKEGAMANA